MIKFSLESKPLVIAAVVALIAAPTAGATLMLSGAARASPPSAQAAAGRTLHIELVAPKEPVVAAAYPLETFESPPANEFKGRPPRGPAWRVSFGDFAPVAMRAEPAGDYDLVVDEESRLEQARFERARDDYVRAEQARAALLRAEDERAERNVRAYEERVFGPRPIEPGFDSDASEAGG
jgi:hypothetical protein